VDVTSNAELNLSDFFENFQVLRLESDAVMGRINRIRYKNDRIYISDGRTLFIFSDSGEFLFHFSKVGQGPGEYSNISDFVVSYDTIIILNRALQRILKYNHMGEFLSEHKLGYFAQNISPTINQYRFLYSGNIYDGLNNTHRLRRIRDGEPDSLLFPVDRHRANYLHIGIGQIDRFFLCQDLNNLYFFETFNDTIYKSVDGKEMKPFFLIDYKGRNVPASFFEGDFANIVEFFREFHRRSSYAYGVLHFVANNHFLIFGSYFQQNRKLTIFDRKDKISRTFSIIRDDIYFNGLVTSIADFAYHADNGYIFLPLDADKIVELRGKYSVSEQFKEIIDAVKWEDNPGLLIFSLKQCKLKN